MRPWLALVATHIYNEAALRHTPEWWGTRTSFTVHHWTWRTRPRLASPAWLVTLCPVKVRFGGSVSNQERRQYWGAKHYWHAVPSARNVRPWVEISVHIKNTKVSNIIRNPTLRSLSGIVALIPKQPMNQARDATAASTTLTAITSWNYSKRPMRKIYWTKTAVMHPTHHQDCAYVLLEVRWNFCKTLIAGRYNFFHKETNDVCATNSFHPSVHLFFFLWGCLEKAS